MLLLGQSVMTTGRVEQQEDGPRRRRRDPRDSQESAVGQMEQLADMGRSDPPSSGLNNHSTLFRSIQRADSDTSGRTQIQPMPSEGL